MEERIEILEKTVDLLIKKCEIQDKQIYLLTKISDAQSDMINDLLSAVSALAHAVLLMNSKGDPDEDINGGTNNDRCRIKESD